MDSPVPVPTEISQAFTEIAQGSRLTSHMVEGCGDPVGGSSFYQVNTLYPFEKVSDRARHYVTAALQHMLMWADHAAPFKFHPEQVVYFTLRPSYTLARAALESAAQAVWLMDTRDPTACVQRHLKLIRWDLQEHRKSYLDIADKERIKEREAELLRRVADVFTDDQLKPPPSYLNIIRDACNPDDLDLDKDKVERIWRAASGAAHGMYWTNLDLQTMVVGDEYEPGHFRTNSQPNPYLMLEALQAAYKMTQYAGLKYLLFAGADPTERMLSGRRWLADQITLKPDADPKLLAQLKGEHPESP
ncbi:hypothetical protein LUPAC06_00510 [Micromonospora saelicesensis]|uniref:hypothetical protein n=1 Tax=Micromonospora saelicesensis TaxID=285676 RepID=UPI000DBF7407|nr:hypothetical protein [Micromonospora saelicesensis]RAO62148.1 hypothetical protein LUPAC06_00510 [Micromonospora saelicesensis]